MDKRYNDIQKRYLVELRQVLPSVLSWWERGMQKPRGGSSNPTSPEGFELRWPAGPAAHPKIIFVFRKYFLEIEELNVEVENERIPDEERDGEDLWGVDDPDERVAYEKPFDILVNDLSSDAPDLFEVMQGMVFIPIGMDPNGEFC